MVVTAMTRTSISLGGMAENSRFLPNPVTYAHAAVATIGIQHTTHGYFYHALQVGSSVAMCLIDGIVVCAHSTLKMGCLSVHCEHV